MGQIISTKNMPNKTVACKIIIDQNEMKNLKGHLKNVHVFSSNEFPAEASINTRGNNGVTKYFRIPLSIRSRKKHNRELEYQKIDTPTKIFYIYTLGVKEQEEEK
jgi:hypothetical protein